MATLVDTTTRAPSSTGRSLRDFVIGPPLGTHEIPHQRIGKAVGLAVFASDALSSTAYATEEIFFVLALAGTGALHLSLPTALAIVALLAVVTISYEQTIHAYPGGGGAYIVARDNLGELAAQTAGAALLTDYILTVSVSISSGVAQITSAFPQLYGARVEIALAFVLIITVVNLRGVKESGKTFALPTYTFLLMAGATLVIGLFRHFTGTLGTVTGVRDAEQGVEALTAFLILRAFSSGCTALTGVEAISNGIQAFKEPSSHNAGITLVWMSGILGTMFLGITFLAGQVHALPSHTETVISQIGRVVYGSGSPLAIVLLGSTTLILIMAANTSFADFPRLGALQAADGFLPKQLTFRGSRLVYSYGIVSLAVMASLLIVVFQAAVTALIPLYAIGVFLSFTLSQTGMALHWRHAGRLRGGEQVRQRGSVVRFDPRWRLKLAINGFGALCTAVVAVIFAVTKFTQGAWIVVVLIPSLVVFFLRIHDHYRRTSARLSLDEFGAPLPVGRHRVIVPISSVHRGVVWALQYAQSLSDDVTALYVSIDPAEAEELGRRWDKWGNGVRLRVIDSPYRTLIEKIIQYVDELEAVRQKSEVLTIVVPHFIAERTWHHLLHAQTARTLRRALLGRKGIVVTDVPYHLRD